VGLRRRPEARAPRGERPRLRPGSDPASLCARLGAADGRRDLLRSCLPLARWPSNAMDGGLKHLPTKISPSDIRNSKARDARGAKVPSAASSKNMRCSRSSWKHSIGDASTADIRDDIDMRQLMSWWTMPKKVKVLWDDHPCCHTCSIALSRSVYVPVREVACVLSWSLGTKLMSRTSCCLCCGVDRSDSAGILSNLVKLVPRWLQKPTIYLYIVICPRGDIGLPIWL
jgi:hypothetical protein